MSRMSKDLLLVGSIPLETEEQVLLTCGHTVGNFVPCLSDGEPGDRSYWIAYLAYRFFHGNPGVETLHRPPPINGIAQWKPTSIENFWKFKVKPGVKEVQFDDLGYATEAIDSYRIFRRLREAGDIPQDVRFMVCLPFPNSAIDCHFRDPADYPIIKPAYEAGIRREIKKMLEKIPAQDLVLQWDVCVELLDIAGVLPWLPADNKFARNVEPIPRLSHDIPEEVLLGYHFCYGTLGGWPMVKFKDLELCVKLSNEAVAKSGRRVDFVHMPATRKCDEAYFQPLRDLKIGDTKVYLGIIHDTDGVEGFQKRLMMARKHLSDFGVASVCGYGRCPVEDVPRVLEVHRAAAETM